MLKSQEIQLAQSKRREKMAEIQKADEITDDARTELRSLTSAYEGAEVELRAALLVEGAERDKIKEPDRAESDFDRECRSFNLSGMVASLTEGKPLTGREAEVSAELENRHGDGQKGGAFPLGKPLGNPCRCGDRCQHQRERQSGVSPHDERS